MKWGLLSRGGACYGVCQVFKRPNCILYDVRFLVKGFVRSKFYKKGVRL